jgi:hypothetical protein
MARLVQADDAAARERNLGYRAPSCFFNVRADHSAIREQSHLRRKIIRHQEQLGSGRLGRMHRDFCGWQREYQPATARVDRREAKHFGEERSISVSVVAVHDEMSTKDHVHMMSDCRWVLWNTPRLREM